MHTSLFFLKQRRALEKTKQEVDERVIHILLSAFPFLSFTHLHQPLSVYIESSEIKREGERKNKCQEKKKRTIKGGRGGAATFESITS